MKNLKFILLIFLLNSCCYLGFYEYCSTTTEIVNEFLSELEEEDNNYVFYKEVARFYFIIYKKDDVHYLRYYNPFQYKVIGEYQEVRMEDFEFSELKETNYLFKNVPATDYENEIAHYFINNDKIVINFEGKKKKYIFLNMREKYEHHDQVITEIKNILFLYYFREKIGI